MFATPRCAGCSTAAAVGLINLVFCDDLLMHMLSVMEHAGTVSTDGTLQRAAGIHGLHYIMRTCHAEPTIKLISCRAAHAGCSR
jgi:hypothetical protein